MSPQSKWILNKIDWNTYQTLIVIIIFPDNHKDPELIIDNITSQIITATTQTMLQLSSKFKKHNVSWCNAEISKCINERKIAWKCYTRITSPDNPILFFKKISACSSSNSPS